MCKADYVTALSTETAATELVILAQNGSSRVRARVAENPNCPLYLLAYLVQDCNPEVRLGVANNPRITMNLLEWLMQDSSADVRFALAEDHNLPAELLVRLTDDENPYVAMRARMTLDRVHQPRTMGEVCPISVDSSVYNLKVG